MISYCYPPNGIVGVFRTVKFARYLPDHGWEPIVLTASSPFVPTGHPELLKGIEQVEVHRTYVLEPVRWYEQRQSRRAISKPSQQSSSEADLAQSARVPASPLGKLKRYVRILLSTPDKDVGWIPTALPKALSIIRNENINCVYCVTPPHSAQFIGYLVKRITGLPLVVDFRDPWSQNHGFETQQPFPSLRRVSEAMERAVHRRADVVIASTVLMGEGFRSKYGNEVGDKYYPILNGYDPEDMSTDDSIAYDKFTVVYGGGVYGHRNWDAFFEGLKRFLASKPSARKQVQFVFLGRGLGTYARNWGLEDVVVDKGYLSQRDVYRHMFQADILLLILWSGPDGAAIVPAKSYEYLATGRPILALVPEGEVAGCIRGNNGGEVLTQPDPTAVESFLADKYAEWEKRCPERIEPRVVHIEKFTRRHQTSQLAKLLDHAVGKNRGRLEL